MIILEQLMEKFLDLLSNGHTDLDTKQLSDDAFSDTNSCKCTYAGSKDYFDRGMGQWYPGDPAEYEVDGYDEYIDYLIDTICQEILQIEPSITVTKELEDIVKSNLSNIMQLNLLTDEQFEDKAITQYLRYVNDDIY